LFYEIIISSLTIISVLISVAFFTLAERKIMAAIQRRQGPIVVGFKGVLQPLADGCKLLIKEIIVPIFTNRAIFLLPPCIMLLMSFIN